MTLSLMRLLLASTFVATCAVSAAQNPADGPSFEVASVKPNKSGAVPGRAPSPEVDRVHAVNTPLRTLIQVAYNIGVDRLDGVPEWIVRERFDLEAKADAPLTGNTWQLMLRTLLADRFKLLVHTKTRDVPLFALVMARSDRRPGPRLRPAAVNCDRHSLFCGAGDDDSLWSDCHSTGGEQRPRQDLDRSQPGGGWPCRTAR